MRWIGLGADALMACLGVVCLLTAYRVIGKPAGVDPQYDAGMARQSWQKIIGWCIIAMAIIGLLDHLVGGLL
jgi:hypothetical protein